MSDNIKNTNDNPYKTKEAVTRKWLKIIKKIGRELGPNRNIPDLLEAFNLVDVVMTNAIFDYKSTHTPIKKEEIYVKDKVKKYGYYYEGVEGYIEYKKSESFYNKTLILERLHFPIPVDKINKYRAIRNCAAHRTGTMAASEFENITMEELEQGMTCFGETLVGLGMMDPQYIRPDSDLLRVGIGDVVGYESSGNIYQIRSLIKEGGTSYVYKADDLKMGRVVAIKEIKLDKVAQDTFRNELRTMVKLRHRNIPQVYNWITQRNTYYIVMEYIDGEDLREYFVDRKVSIVDKIQMIIDICDLLRYLHSDQNGIIYCDLKPDNLLVNKKGEIYLIDFGFSQKGEIATNAGYSWNYVAPEQLNNGLVDERTDIYALGYLMKFILYGYEKNSSSLNADHGKEKLDSIINNCIKENPNERYSDVGFIMKELIAIRDEYKGKLSGSQEQVATVENNQNHSDKQEQAVDYSQYYGGYQEQAVDASQYYGDYQSQTSDTSQYYVGYQEQMPDTNQYYGGYQSQATDTNQYYGGYQSQTADTNQYYGGYQSQIVDNTQNYGGHQENVAQESRKKSKWVKGVIIGVVVAIAVCFVGCFLYNEIRYKQGEVHFSYEAVSMDSNEFFVETKVYNRTNQSVDKIGVDYIVTYIAEDNSIKTISVIKTYQLSEHIYEGEKVNSVTLVSTYEDLGLKADKIKEIKIEKMYMVE